MRVYFLNHSAAPNHLGGSELSLLNLIEGWVARDPDFVPTIVGPTSRSALVAEARRRGYATFNVPFEGWAIFTDPGGRPEAALRTRRDFASTVLLIERMTADSPDLVVTNTIVSPWGAYAAAALGIPHVWFMREFADEAQGFRFPAGRDIALEDVGLLSELVVANSDALRSALSQHIPAKKLVTSYPAIDVVQVRALADQPLPTSPFTLPAADLRVVVVGRITRTKGQWRVIEAIGRLRARGVRVAACFVGVTVEADADVLLARRAKRLGIADAITFVGEQVNPFPFVVAADVGITPSDLEAFGRTTFEYMALGRPVVASRGGGSDELVVDGETGYLVDPDDIDLMAARLEELARDPELRSRQQQAGRERAETLVTTGSIDRIVDLLVATAAHEVPRLPATVVSWLEVPELFGPSRERALSARVQVRHLGRRVAGALRHPWATVRRRWLRARHLSARAGRPLAGPPSD